jgi:phosphoglycerate dehydrogenase-like enzyme
VSAMVARVGISSDLLNSANEFSFGQRHIEVLDRARDVLRWELLPPGLKEIDPEIGDGFDALYLNTPLVTARSLGGGSRLKIVARHGVGYDSVDVGALTRTGVILTNTPLAVRRPVATMALTFMLALAQRLLEKDRLTREGRWHERNDYMGTGLTGRTLGLVGAGGIARDLVTLVAPFEMRVIAADPYVSPETAQAAGLELAGLATVMAEADFVVIACLLNDETRRLVDADMIGRMKPSAYLINVARGPILHEAALIEALQQGRIAGAGLDVFEEEPVDPSNPLLAMPNVVVTPHALCWTDENFGAIARTAMGSIVSTLSRRRPDHIVNPEALSHPKLKAWFGAAASDEATTTPNGG